MCRPYGAFRDRTRRPTAPAVGYIMSSLTGLQATQSHVLAQRQDSYFLRDRLLGLFYGDVGEGVGGEGGPGGLGAPFYGCPGPGGAGVN